MFKLNAYQLKVYNANLKTNPESCFYILNKGNNAGRPMLMPCPNCFVVIAKSETERDILYWLTFAAWKTKRFLPFLKGTTILNLTTPDAKYVLNECILGLNQLEVKHNIKALKKTEKLEKLLVLQLEKFKELKHVLAASFFKS
ncbi:MAG: DUF6943 family protein [Psychroflexus halocasei]